MQMPSYASWYEQFKPKALLENLLILYKP
jgi:hypothetical protein